MFYCFIAFPDKRDKSFPLAKYDFRATYNKFSHKKRKKKKKKKKKEEEEEREEEEDDDDNDDDNGVD